MAKVGDIEIKLKVETKKFNSDMNKAEKSAKKFSKNTTKNVKNMSKSVTMSLGSIKKAVLGLGTAFAVFKGASFAKNIITDMAASAKETLAWSRALKIGTTELQGFSLAAGQVGFSSEKVADIFKDVSDKVGDFVNTGGGEAKDVFERLGLSVDELKGKSPDKVVQRISDRIEELNGTVNELNSQDKIFLTESLANDFSKMLPLLENGGKKLKEFQEIAKQSGAILSPEDLKSLELLRKQTSVISLQWQGLKNIIGVELLPSITKLAKKIKEAFQNGSIQKFVAGAAAKMGKMLDNAIKKIPMMVDSFKSAIPILQTLGELISGMAKGLDLALSAAKGYGRYLGLLSASIEGISLKNQRGEYDPNAKETGGSGGIAITQAQPMESVDKILRGLLDNRAAEEASKIQKEAADKQASAAAAQQKAAALVKSRSETAIGQILGSRGKGEAGRILGAGPEQAKSENFDRIFRQIVADIQTGSATKGSTQAGMDQLNQIAAGLKTFGPQGSTLGMENAIKDLQNFIAGKKDDEIKVNISVDVKPSENFDTELETKIIRTNGNSFSDAAAMTGQ